MKIRIFVYGYRRSHSKKPDVKETSEAEPPKSVADQRKVFVGGILPSTTKSSVESALSQLGQIKLLNVCSQRGFAVVLFEQPQTTDLAISTRWYIIDGKRVELRPFVAKREDRMPIALTNVMSSNSSINLADSLASRPLSPVPSNESLSGIKRIFVGGIPVKTTEVMLRSSLSQFGPIEKVVIFSTRGYGLVTFENSESVASAITTQWLFINDKKVELLPYEPGKKERKHKHKSESM